MAGAIILETIGSQLTGYGIHGGNQMVRAIRLEPTTRSALFGGTKILKDRGFPEIAKHAVSRLQAAQTGAPAVVIVGEVKRGKSSLVNALIGHPNASPVGVDVTTNAFVRITTPTAKFRDGAARLIFADGRREIPLAEVPQWITVAGQYAQDPASPIPRGVEMALPAKYLPDIDLVDTPGVGGLTSAHLMTARHAASWASLLVFVTDAGQPLTAPELTFLSELSETVETIVLVVTKKDLYPAGWREIVAENKSLLAKFAPRFAQAPICVVSSQLANQATTVPDGPMKQALEEASGIPELAAILAQRAGSADSAGVANALRVVRSGLDQVQAQLVARKEAASGTAEVLAELTNERSRLEKLSNQQSRWTLDLDRDMGRIRSDSITLATKEFAEARDRWTRKIAGERRAMSTGGRRQMMSEISIDLETVSERVANNFYGALYQAVFRLFEQGADAESVLGQVSGGLRQIQVQRKELRPSGVAKFDPGLATSAIYGVSIANGIGGFAVAGFFNPIALAIGGTWLAVNLTYRVIKGGKAQLQTWMQETTQAFQAELVAVTDNVIRDFRPEVIVGFREYLSAASAELKLAIREAETAAATGAKERQARIDAIERHVVAVRAQATAVDEALAAVLAPPAQKALPAAGTKRALPTSNKAVSK